jgi:hypothetical protein
MGRDPEGYGMQSRHDREDRQTSESGLTRLAPRVARLGSFMTARVADRL